MTHDVIRTLVATLLSAFISASGSSYVTVKTLGVEIRHIVEQIGRSERNYEKWQDSHDKRHERHVDQMHK